MKSIVLFPTVEEATPFLMTETKTPVFVTGTDPAEMAAGTVRAIRAKKPKLLVLAGLATATDRSIPLGSVVEVVSARMAAGAQEYAATGPVTGLPEVTSLTISTAAQDVEIPQTQVTDREGAVFFAVCEAMEVDCCQIRAVSHYWGDAPDAEQTQAALRNLTETLTETLTQISENYG